MKQPAAKHIPVLPGLLMETLTYGPESTIVDCTVGQGGHSRLLGEQLSPTGQLIGLDVDPDSLAVAQQTLEALSCRVSLQRENFGYLDQVLDALAIDQVDIILADIGISSAQLADASRGISFQEDGPLDMRMDDRLERTAADLVNQTRQDDLADLIYKYGEERKSRRIARGIVEARRKKSITRTGELVDVILKSLGIRGDGRKSKIHPATRTFQALRIAVNDELGQLENLLAIAAERLKPGGQVAIISFHSLEDRIVKYDFRQKKSDGLYEIITKKPLIAGEDEVKANPRSRSAKLRVAKRI